MLEAGTVMNDEIVNYEMEIFDNGFQDDFYTAVLGLERGNANMFLRFCDGTNETCRLITSNDIQKGIDIDYSAYHESIVICLLLNQYQ